MVSAKIDLVVGGNWQFLHKVDEQGTAGLEGEYIEIIPNEKLVFSWSYVVTDAEGHREATPHSRVCIEFSQRGNGTEIKLVHSKIKTDDARAGVGSGWEKSFEYFEEFLLELKHDG
ncbi:MAG: SRPBCC family protein [Pseudomonadota bacterium]